MRVKSKRNKGGPGGNLPCTRAAFVVDIGYGATNNKTSQVRMIQA